MVVIAEIPTLPPRFLSRFVNPLASPIFSREMLAMENVVIGTKMQVTEKPLITIGKMILDGAI